MLKAGWNAHKLNAPGKFLVSAPEHDTPRRARAYLLTDEMVTQTAAWHSQIPRRLDDISRAAILNSSAFPAPVFQPEHEEHRAVSPGNALRRAQQRTRGRMGNR